MIDAFGNPIVIGARYKTSDNRNRERTSTMEGTATKVFDGVNGTKITLTDLVSEPFVHGTSLGKRVEKGSVSIYPCHLFPVPKD